MNKKLIFIVTAVPSFGISVTEGSVVRTTLNRLAWDRDRWWVLVNAVMNIRIS
jgi:hypothetical protein